MPELLLSLYGRDAATVRPAADGYRLDYLDEWRDTPGAIGLGHRLPVTRARHRHALVRDHLDGLLPDDPGLRVRWARDARLPGADILHLLSVYGLDAPGALELRPASRPQREAPALTALTDDDIARRVRALRRDPGSWHAEGAAGGPTLAGARGKIAVVRKAGRWFEASGSHPTTHVLKPGADTRPDIDIVEHLLSRVARAIGLPVVETGLEDFAGERTLVVTRFDRITERDGTVRRLHQEDLVQALGVPRFRQHQAHGGPGVAEILDLLDAALSDADAAYAREVLVKALVYAWVVVGTGVRPANMALTHLPGGRTVLAPLYGLSTALPYTGREAMGNDSLRRAFADHEPPLRLGVSPRLGDTTAGDLAPLARRAGLAPAELVTWAGDLCAALPRLLGNAIEALPAGHVTPTVDLLAEQLRVRAAQALRSFTLS